MRRDSAQLAFLQVGTPNLGSSRDRLSFKSDRFVDISLNNWLRWLPPQAVTSHLNLDREQIAKIPSEKELVIAG
jgi:hypothetical protein